MVRALLMTSAVAASLAGRAEVDDPMTVTTDTPEYCLALADQMAARGEMPAHALYLWRIGRAMCEEGRVRPGLVRLRRAMMMIKGVAE